MEKRQPLQQMLQRKVAICLQKTETRSMPVTCTSTNLKSFQDLNIKPETLKLAQKKAGNIWELIGIGNDFLRRTQLSHQIRERIHKWDYMKLKSFCTTKEMVSKLKRPLKECKKIFSSCTSDKD
jgi:hypothetical protein